MCLRNYYQALSLESILCPLPGPGVCRYWKVPKCWSVAHPLCPITHTSRLSLSLPLGLSPPGKFSSPSNLWVNAGHGSKVPLVCPNPCLPSSHSHAHSRCSTSHGASTNARLQNLVQPFVPLLPFVPLSPPSSPSFTRFCRAGPWPVAPASFLQMP